MTDIGAIMDDPECRDFCAVESSEAYDINNAGTIVGDYMNGLGDPLGFLFVNASFWTSLSVEGNYGDARAVNESHEPVGSAEFGALPMVVHAYINGPFGVGDIDLGTLPFPDPEAAEELSSAALDVNDVGQVVGWSDTDLSGSNNSHAVLWENGTVVDLGTLGGSRSQATGINSKGQVVGWSTTNDAETHAFLWENGVMIDLGTLGGSSSQAQDINEVGQIVGFSSLAGDAVVHATMWIIGPSVPPSPTTKAECKKGGWEAFGFRNQGQCIRLVESGKDSRNGQNR
jgi:probable HAF family extracellular repeat protein